MTELLQLLLLAPRSRFLTRFVNTMILLQLQMPMTWPEARPRRKARARDDLVASETSLGGLDGLSLLLHVLGDEVHLGSDLVGGLQAGLGRDLGALHTVALERVLDELAASLKVSIVLNSPGTAYSQWEGTSCWGPG